ncbi:hypothetical protein TRVA0_050S00694 [Trichomonascus vanleenenianus]|uniref:uncharacterized protein n=1 Tax=Trichomonascus vanleenenianus TaxID=2268995 RepID=UPI003ECA8696
MPQGVLKKSAGKSKVAKKQCPKKAAPKLIAPKKQRAVKEARITKKHTAAITAATEKLIASRVGHLELLKGTRREIEKEKKKETAKSD